MENVGWQARQRLEICLHSQGVGFKFYGVRWGGVRKWVFEKRLGRV